jgi:hypothetical protein
MQCYILNPLLRFFFCGTLLLAGGITAFQLNGEIAADRETCQTTQSEHFSNLSTHSVPQAPLSEILEENEEEKDSANTFKSLPLVSGYANLSNIPSLKTKSSSLDVQNRYLLFHCLRLDC